MSSRLSQPHVSMPISELAVLLEATLLFAIQMLIAQNPELLASPDEADASRSAVPLCGARRILAAIRELHDALESYHDAFHGRPSSSYGDDDIPF